MPINNNYAIKFDSTNASYIELPIFSDIQNKVTMMAWFQAMGAPKDGYHIVIARAADIEISVPQYTGEIRTSIVTNTLGRVVFNSGSGLVDGNPHHVAMTYDGTTLSSYIDGNLTGAVPANGLIQLNNANFGIGRYGSYTNYGANGIIDEVSVWKDIALTQDEIRLYMNKVLKGNEQGLIGYWRLNEGSGSVINDSSIYKNNAILYGSQWVGGLVDLGLLQSLKINVNSIWKDGQPFININGVWKPASDIWTNINGVWKKI
jgi:hypothetical protein